MEGNQMKMREALEKIREKCVIHNNDLAEEIDALCGNALDAPQRNCDVGTAEEQAERMNRFCDSHGHGFDRHGTYACENCEFISVDRCELAWAQMPYEAEEGDAK